MASHYGRHYICVCASLNKRPDISEAEMIRVCTHPLSGAIFLVDFDVFYSFLYFSCLTAVFYITERIYKLDQNFKTVRLTRLNK